MHASLSSPLITTGHPSLRSGFGRTGTYAALKDMVGARAGGGESLDAIGADLIEPSGLPDEQKSALWLYGWICRQEGVSRYERRQQRTRRSARQAATPSPAALRSDVG
jgi:hypothetical protein